MGEGRAPEATCPAPASPFEVLPLQLPLPAGRLKFRARVVSMLCARDTRDSRFCTPYGMVPIHNQGPAFPGRSTWECGLDFRGMAVARWDGLAWRAAALLPLSYIRGSARLFGERCRATVPRPFSRAQKRGIQTVDAA